MNELLAIVREFCTKDRIRMNTFGIIKEGDDYLVAFNIKPDSFNVNFVSKSKEQALIAFLVMMFEVRVNEISYLRIGNTKLPPGMSMDQLDYAAIHLFQGDPVLMDALKDVLKA